MLSMAYHGENDFADVALVELDVVGCKFGD